MAFFIWVHHNLNLFWSLLMRSSRGGDPRKAPYVESARASPLSIYLPLISTQVCILLYVSTSEFEILYLFITPGGASQAIPQAHNQPQGKGSSGTRSGSDTAFPVIKDPAKLLASRNKVTLMPLVLSMLTFWFCNNSKHLDSRLSLINNSR